jgi:4-hydroxythreonine-4-phosphate dehydrogenase
MSPALDIGDTRPRIAITIGDPAGIGPEIVLKALQDPEIYVACRPVVYGSPDVVDRELAGLGLRMQILEGGPDLPTAASPSVVHLVPTSGREALVPYGLTDAAGGEAAVSAVRSAVQAAVTGAVDAICTAPLNKTAMHLAGHPFDGHTEMLQVLTNSGPVSMLLMGERLRVAHVTTHRALRTVSEQLTPLRLATVIRIADAVLRRAGFGRPRIAVAGLNPHAGEGGLFGDEEKLVMLPTIAEVSAQGIDVYGPVSPDAVFIDALAGRCDIVVAIYHDQGHIPVKLIERDKAVNVTGGLPITRTSVDHGTAFDIAGKGIAESTNMTAALSLAARLAGGAQSSNNP